jgi:hypothetical protein
MKMEEFKKIMSLIKIKYEISTDNLDMDKDDLESKRRTDIDTEYFQNIDMTSIDTDNL